MAKWYQHMKPRTNEFLKMGAPPSWDRPDEIQRRVEMMRRSMSIYMIDEAYEEMFLIITTGTYLSRQRIYDPDDETDPDMPELEDVLPDQWASHLDVIEARYYIQAQVHHTNVGQYPYP